MSTTEDQVIPPQPTTATGVVLQVTRPKSSALASDVEVDDAPPPPPPPPEPNVGVIGSAPPPPRGPGGPPPPVPGAKATPSAPPRTLTKEQQSYVSSAFKSGLKPAMFDLVKHPGYAPDKLADVCAQFNYVVKNAGDLRDVVLAKVGLNKGITADVDPGQLEAKLKEFWSTLHALRRDQDAEEAATSTSKTGEASTTDASSASAELPPIPSAAAIRESALNWKKGGGVDPLKAVRPRAIANVKMDPDDPKKVVVGERALKDANRELAAQGSFIRLQPVGKPDKDGFVKIRPVWDVAKQVTAKHDEAHTKLLDINRERQAEPSAEGEALKDAQYVSWADCHRTAQTIMGSEELNSGIGDTERVRLKGGDALVAPVPKAQIGQISLATDHGANRAMHAMFGHAMSKLGDDLRVEVPGETAARVKAKKLILDAIDEAIAERDRAPGERVGKAPPNFRAVYRLLQPEIKEDDEPEKKAEKEELKALLKAFTTTYGINEAIKPKVGSALAQINDEAEKQTATDRDLWNFHFAGVVLVNEDGSYMTMENLSVEDATAVNDDWYFALYDPKQGKSFHEVNKQDSHVGKYPTTLMFEKMPPS